MAEITVASSCFHDLQKLKLMGNVQMVRGLVQNEAGGLLGQGPGKNHPLLLTAGERRKAPVRKLSHSNGLSSASATIA